MKTIPFDTKTILIQEAIKGILLDSIVHDRLIQKVYSACQLFGTVADLEEVDMHHEGYVRAVRLMGYSGHTHSLLWESLYNAYSTIASDESIPPPEAVDLIRESWEVITREYASKEAV